MSTDDLDGVIEGYRDALRAYVKGDPDPASSYFSTRDDVTLANPLGPPQRGPSDIRRAAAIGAAGFQEGGPLRFTEVSSRFEEVSRYAVPDLGYLVQLERHEGRVDGRPDGVVIILRSTTVFRREDGHWRIAHRHADPIMTPRPVDSTVQP